LAATGGGCHSIQTLTTLEGPKGPNNSSQPYVEAYVEYPGPQSKWAGPASYILHVTAKDAGLAQITMTPELMEVERPKADRHDDEVTSTTRAPAASAAMDPAASASVAPPASVTPGPAFRNMTSDEARAQLAYMANALQGAQAPFRGCMSPVRVRMVRSNGGILEKQGCRSELGWSRAVSETVSTFVDASINGMQAKLSAEPVRAISSEAVGKPGADKPASDEAPSPVSKI
jgi:hypothetical protein